MNIIDRRCEPRYATRYPTQVTTHWGDIVDVFTTNLSLSGLELSGSHRMITTLFPTFKRDNQHLPVEVSIELNVPCGNMSPEIIKVKCFAIYCRRRRMDCYSVGCQFSEMNEEAESRLGQCIEDLSRQQAIEV